MVVDVASDDPTEGTVSPGQLVFTTTSWADEQEVTVTPVDDGQVDGAMTYLVTLTVDDAASPDDYDGIIDAAVVTNLDVDVIFERCHASFQVEAKRTAAVDREQRTVQGFRRRRRRPRPARRRR